MSGKSGSSKSKRDHKTSQGKRRSSKKITVPEALKVNVLHGGMFVHAQAVDRRLATEAAARDRKRSR